MVRMDPQRIRFLIQFFCIIGVSFLVNGCSHEQIIDFDISGGSADMTLKEFAKQADVEVVFDPRSVKAIITNPVSGEFSPREALELMLEGTDLRVQKDSTTGAIAIIHKKSSRDAGRIN
jgi:hypothetical protein